MSEFVSDATSDITAVPLITSHPFSENRGRDAFLVVKNFYACAYAGTRPANEGVWKRAPRKLRLAIIVCDCGYREPSPSRIEAGTASITLSKPVIPT